jgi:hypothetical protein
MGKICITANRKTDKLRPLPGSRLNSTLIKQSKKRWKHIMSRINAFNGLLQQFTTAPEHTPWKLIRTPPHNPHAHAYLARLKRFPTYTTVMHVHRIADMITNIDRKNSRPSRLRRYFCSEHKGYCVHYGRIEQPLQTQRVCINSYFGAKCQSHCVLCYAPRGRIVNATILATLIYPWFHGSERSRSAIPKLIRK